MTATRTRLLGSGMTVVFFGGPDGHIPLGFCQMINETPPELVAQYRPIQPIDWEHPAEIMTAMAMGAGTVDLDFYENWSEQAWNRLEGGLNTLGGIARGRGASDTILDIVRAVSDAQGGIYLSKLIKTPRNSGETTVDHHRRAVLYMGAKIVRVADGDTNVAVDTMEQPKRVTFAYTHRVYQRNRLSSRGAPDNNPANVVGSEPRINRPI
jgi:hypothetical protein